MQFNFINWPKISHIIGNCLVGITTLLMSATSAYAGSSNVTPDNFFPLFQNSLTRNLRQMQDIDFFTHQGWNMCANSPQASRMVGLHVTLASREQLLIYPFVIKTLAPDHRHRLFNSYEITYLYLEGKQTKIGKAFIDVTLNSSHANAPLYIWRRIGQQIALEIPRSIQHLEMAIPASSLTTCPIHQMVKANQDLSDLIRHSNPEPTAPMPPADPLIANAQ